MAGAGNAPLIVEVKRHSHEDGPGIRSVVFFKGCPLRCRFCHNPETQDPRPEVAFTASACLQCGQCRSACPAGAIALDRAGRIRRDRCRRCGACARACPGKALRLVGTPWPVETLVELLLRDLPYYRHSGGGVTLSGGECTLYPNYLAALLQRLKDAGVHVTLETCGQFEYESFEQNVLPGLDLIYYDIKCAASDDHQRLTGRRNDRILENLRRLIARKQPPVVVRTPLVPGLTATPENLSALVDILSRIGVRELTLLPYNPMGLEMYEKLGRPQPNLPQRFMTAEEENEVRKVFERLLLRSRPRFDSSVHEELDHLFLTAQGEGRA